MRRLKVLILPSWYPSEDNPIRGIFLKEQAEALNQYVDVAVLSVNSIRLNQPRKIIHTKRKVTNRENGLFTFKLNYVNWAPKITILSNKIYEKRLIEGYQEVIKKFGVPDLIHAHVSYPAGYGAMVLSNKFKVPYMVTEHASFFENTLMTKYSSYTKETLIKADYYSAVSSDLKNKIVKTGRKQCEVIPNFINTEKFNSTKKPKDGYNNIFNLVHVSVMKYIKGIDILLRSLHNVIYSNKYENVHLHLIGYGAEKQKYENLAEELNLQEFCTFHGRVDNNNLGNYLNSSDILIISSRSETFGVVGIEAMASGIPVIATRCGGPEDYIKDAVGILVEKESVDSLSEGIIEMIKNYDKYDASVIKKYVNDNYSTKVVCEKIIDIYQKLVLYNS